VTLTSLTPWIFKLVIGQQAGVQIRFSGRLNCVKTSAVLPHQR
jgi:hypothetical protein